MARAPAAQVLEELPEADRLDGFPHPRMTPQLYGHADAERALAEAFRGGRMHHGWLITGREGIGKATLAWRFARYALASPREREKSPLGTLAIGDETIAARQVRALSHPGLLLLRRPYDHKAKRLLTTISVDEVRRLRGFLSHSAAQDTWRVVIVDQADEMNTSAANALLKSLEEPPSRLMFLLIASEPGRLLTTIRSRCRTLALPPLASEPLRQAVAQAVAAGEDAKAPVPSAWPTLEALAQGSVRRVLVLSGAGGLELYERIHALIASLPKVDWQQVHTLSDELAGAAADQRFELFYDLLMGLMTRLARVLATGEGIDSDRALAARVVGPGRLASWAELWETLAREKADIVSLNLDRKTLIIETVARLQAVTSR